MPPQDDKLDGLAAAVSDLRVVVAGVAGDARAILQRLEAQDRTDRDHEDRIRVIESHGTKDHGPRLSVLERWRWLVTGGAAALGGGSGGAIGYFVSHATQQHPH